MKTEIDKRKLTVEQQALLEQHDMLKEQVGLLSDSAEMLQEVVNILGSDSKSDDLKHKEMGAVLTDMRESLQALKNRENPESPDYATPVVDAIKNLDTSINALEVKPTVKVSVPEVKVPKPEVTVDLKEVNKTLKGLKQDFPSALSDESSLVYYQGKPHKPQHESISSTTSGYTTVIPGAPNKLFLVISCFLLASDDTVIKFMNSDGEDLTGNIGLVASTGFVLPYNPAGWTKTSPGDSLVLQQSQAVTVGGMITYIEIGV